MQPGTGNILARLNRAVGNPRPAGRSDVRHSLDRYKEGYRVFEKFVGPDELASLHQLIASHDHLFKPGSGKAGMSLPYHVLDGFNICKNFPQLREYAAGPLRNAAEETFGVKSQTDGRSKACDAHSVLSNQTRRLQSGTSMVVFTARCLCSSTAMKERRKCSRRNGVVCSFRFLICCFRFQRSRRNLRSPGRSLWMPEIFWLSKVGRRCTAVSLKKQRGSGWCSWPLTIRWEPSQRRCGTGLQED